MTTALQIAQRHWGAVPCHGQAAVSWTSSPDAQVNAMSTWANPVDSYAAPDENVDCVIALNPAASWDWPKLCTVVTHEVGHLLGHPHSLDRADVMYAMYISPTPECAAAAEPEGTLTAAVEQARASVQAQAAAFAAASQSDPVAAPPTAQPRAKAAATTSTAAPIVTMSAVPAATARSGARAATQAHARRCSHKAARASSSKRQRAARRKCATSARATKLRTASAASQEPFERLSSLSVRSSQGGSAGMFAPFGALLTLLLVARGVTLLRRRHALSVSWGR